MLASADPAPVAWAPGAFGRLAAGLAGLRGWRRLALAATLGVIAAGALPPLYLLPLLWPAFCGLLWLLAGAANWRQAFALGWLFGFGFFVAGLYWVGISMTVDLARFGWFMPVSVGGLSAGLALFTGLVTFVTWRLAWRGAAAVLVFVAAWLLAEFLRGALLSGFPWNLLGTVWAFSALPLQGAALFGVWGLSVVTLLAAAAPSVLAEPGSGRGTRVFVIVSLLLVVALWGGGAWRLALAPAPGENDTAIRLRLIQPSIDQQEKWNAANRIEHVRRQMELTLGGGLEGISHIIWPEAAVPFFLNERADLRAVLAEIVPPGGSLITGAPALDRPSGGGEPRLYNSLYALDGTGRISARYDKVHLVPFGEFVPLGRLIGMTKLTAGRIDFTPGPGARSLQVEGLPPFSPQICYEVIFSGQVVAETGARPGWLLNLTNDAWFGRSSGPYQHFANVRLRAVEEGLPLIRSANNGISAVIDPYGRLRARLGLDEIGVIDTALPAPAARMTPYAQIGRWVILPLFVLLVLAGALIHRRRRSAAIA